MPGISFDVTEVARLRGQLQQLPASARPKLWQAVRATSFTVERWVKQQMPVDTGHARNSWGHSTPPALPDEAIWTEDEAHMTLTQGSRVPYIEQLNEGWSKQAPAGFIDAIELRGEAELERAVDAALQELGL